MFVDALAVTVGGGGIVVNSLIEALADRDDVELVVALSGDSMSDLERRGRLRVIRVRSLPLLGRLLTEQLLVPWHSRRADVLLAPANFAIALAVVPQVLLVQNAYHFGGEAREIRRHSLRFPLRSRLWIEASAARLSVRRVTITVAVSEWLAGSVRSDCEGADVRIVPNATPVMPHATRQSDDPYVVCVAHDQVHKDWEGMATAFEQHPDLPPLVVAGSPRSAARMKRLRARFPRTTFLGQISDRRKIAALYAGASCCVVHSFLESSSLTPLEALACGLPVAASDIPVHRELVDHDVALYPPHDHNALADAVRRALANGRRSPGTPLWNWTDAAEAWMEILREARRRPSSVNLP